jgi:hypothetical protein
MLGVPVQFLNDRDKLNRPNSQIGFLEFMIAPYFAAQIRIFNSIHEYGDNLASNLASWEDLWVKEVQPDPEARAKVRARVEKTRLMLEEAKQTSAPPANQISSSASNRPAGHPPVTATTTVKVSPSTAAGP